jgi:hypothetical protein
VGGHAVLVEVEGVGDEPWFIDEPGDIAGPENDWKKRRDDEQPRQDGAN